MNAWRDTWTIKNYKWVRELKETQKQAKQLALADIFDTYQRELSERGLIDFSDMILEAIWLIEGNDIVRMSLAETYQFIMIDEFQDTNEAQMRLINGILSVNTENPNIFAVGDDDQSIFKFQWANTKNIRDFHTRYTDTRLIILEANYRSKSEIITASRAVIRSESNDIAHIFPGAEKKFEAVREAWWSVRKVKFQNELEEISWIVEDIVWKISNGTHPSNIAIIAKKNKTLELIAKWLLSKGIAANLSKDESIFDNDAIRLIVSIVKLLHSLTLGYSDEDKRILLTILSHPCFQIDRLTLWNISKTIYHARRDTTRSWIETLAHHEEKNLRNTANWLRELSMRSHTERLEDIIDMITGANSLSLPDDYDEDGKSNPLQIDMFAWERSDFVSPLYHHFFGQLSNDKWSNIIYARHLANMRGFIESIRWYKNGRNFLALSDAIDLLTLIEKYDLDIEVSHMIGDEKTSVNLITVYKSKWLEWDHVYVPLVHTKEYKSWKIGGSPLPKNLPLEAERDDDSDIERLVYTAFTRAADSLTMTYSEETMSEKSLEPLACIGTGDDSWTEWSITTPLTSLVDTLEVEKKELFALPYTWEEESFLRDRIEKTFVMNATALQNFLNIADAGPEYFVANTLLRFPQAKNIAASYGSAIHKALEDFFADYISRGTYEKKILMTSFETYLQKEGFDHKTESTYLTRGRENLESLYTEIAWQSYGELSLEYDFRSAHGGVFLPVSDVPVILSETKDPGNIEMLDSSQAQTDKKDISDHPTNRPSYQPTTAIQLTGKIDRIERLPDGSLIITDYKTGWWFDTFDGKWPDYAQIKQWKYRLQLSFYAILFELSPRWRMFHQRSYELFFVEKNHDEDRFHRVIEHIQTGEIDRTKRLIIAVMSKIWSLDFPDVSKYPKTLEGIRMFEEDLLNWQI
jgi:DNA helicase II / ATP-dependent DNA helicase PcrA